VHWYRNIFSHVPSTKVRVIAAMLKTIHASEDVVAAREKAIRVIEKLRGLRFTKAAELAEAAVEETLSLCLPGGALAAHAHQQPARAHPARDQAAYPRGQRLPEWGNRPRTLPRPGCAKSPAPHGRPSDT
jgi:hypothetical protein